MDGDVKHYIERLQQGGKTGFNQVHGRTAEHLRLSIRARLDLIQKFCFGHRQEYVATRNRLVGEVEELLAYAQDPAARHLECTVDANRQIWIPAAESSTLEFRYMG